MVVILMSILLVTVIGFFLYIKKEQTNSEKKFENERRIFLLVENSKDIVYYYQVKPELKFRYVSPSLELFLGKGVIEEGYRDPRSVFERIHPDDYETLSKKVSGEIDYNQTLIQRWRDNDGNYRWFEEYSRPVYEKGELIAVEGIIRNIDEKVKLQQDLEYRIHHDFLTGLHNREYLERNMELFNKKTNVAIGIIICDLDELKYINDYFGHKQGDVLIKEAASILKQCCKDNEVVARVGGDEFAIILTNTNEWSIQTFCQKIASEMARFNERAQDLTIKLSYGYAFSDQSIGKMESLYAEADQNMYQDKNRKRLKGDRYLVPD